MPILASTGKRSKLTTPCQPCKDNPSSPMAIIPICGRPLVGSRPSNWQCKLPTGQCAKQCLHCAASVSLNFLTFPRWVASMSKHVRPPQVARIRIQGQVMMDRLAADEDKQGDEERPTQISEMEVTGWKNQMVDEGHWKTKQPVETSQDLSAIQFVLQLKLCCLNEIFNMFQIPLMLADGWSLITPFPWDNKLGRPHFHKISACWGGLQANEKAKVNKG